MRPNVVLERGLNTIAAGFDGLDAASLRHFGRAEDLLQQLPQRLARPRTTGRVAARRSAAAADASAAAGAPGRPTAAGAAADGGSAAAAPPSALRRVAMRRASAAAAPALAIRLATTASDGAAMAGMAMRVACELPLRLVGDGSLALLRRDDESYQPALAHGLIGLPEWAALAAASRAKRPGGPLAATLLGVALVLRAAAILPRLGVRLAVGIGIVLAALLGAMGGLLLQLAREATQRPHALAPGQAISPAGAPEPVSTRA